MAALDFTTSIILDNSAKEVFDAINNVRGWWQGEIEGSTDKLDDEFTYRMKEFHFSKQKIVELVPNERIVWLVTERNLSFTKSKSEWTRTKIIFEIVSLEGKTTIAFTHAGLKPTLECYDGCSNGWEMLIQESLKSLIITGIGIEVFG